MLLAMAFIPTTRCQRQPLYFVSTVLVFACFYTLHAVTPSTLASDAPQEGNISSTMSTRIAVSYLGWSATSFAAAGLSTQDIGKISAVLSSHPDLVSTIATHRRSLSLLQTPSRTTNSAESSAAALAQLEATLQEELASLRSLAIADLDETKRSRLAAWVVSEGLELPAHFRVLETNRQQFEALAHALRAKAAAEAAGSQTSQTNLDLISWATSRPEVIQAETALLNTAAIAASLGQ